MFCYIFSFQLRKPESWHKTKKSHKVKKHKKRFNCLLLIFLLSGINLWFRLNGSSTLRWGQGKCTPPKTAVQLPGCRHSPNQTHPKPGAQRQGWRLLPAHPVILQAITACATAVHKRPHELSTKTTPAPSNPSLIAAECWALIWQHSGQNYSASELSRAHTKQVFDEARQVCQTKSLSKLFSNYKKKKPKNPTLFSFGCSLSLQKLRAINLPRTEPINAISNNL